MTKDEIALCHHTRSWRPRRNRIEPSRALTGSALKLAQNCYRLAPKSPLQNVRFRLELANQTANSRALQQVVKGWCAHNPLFWLNAFVWSLDTRKVGGAALNTCTPFISYKVQDEAFLTILRCTIPEPGERQWKLLIEKTRDMGATWLCAMAYLWMWLFQEDRVTFLCMSYTEEKVDGGDDSIFGKIDYALEHLPSWMVPSFTRTSKPIINLINHDTGSSIKGSANTGRAGVSGRFTGMFFDEFPLVGPNDRLIYHKTADVSNARIFNGTPNGTHTMFYEMTRLGEADGFKRLRMHWSDHHEKAKGLYRWNTDAPKPELLDAWPPPKDYNFIRDGKLRSPWYDQQCRERGNNPQAIAQELDIDYFAAGHQFFDYAEILRLIKEYGTPPLGVGSIKQSDEGDAMFVADPAGHLKLWFRVGHKGRPAPGRYGVGCDIASGTQGKFATASCASVVNLDTGEKVAELRDARMRPDQFAAVVAELARWFHGAVVNWENIGPGVTFKNVLMDDCKYANVRLRKKNTGSLSPTITRDVGWVPSPADQQELMESYRAALSSGRFLNRSTESLEELRFFSYDGRGGVTHDLQMVTDNPSGARANHGDMGWADALAWMMVRDIGAVFQPGGKVLAPPTEAPIGSPAWWQQQDELDDDHDGWGRD